MAILTYPDSDRLSPEAQAIIEGMPLNLVRMLAGLGSAFPAFFALIKSLGNSAALSASDRERIALKVAHMTGSDYVWAQHEAIALGLGLTDEEIHATRLPAEDPLLRLVEALVSSPEAPPEVIESVRNARSEAAVHEGILVTGLFMFLGRYSRSLKVEIDNIRDERRERRH